jgi:hypothetical protein
MIGIAAKERHDMDGDCKSSRGTNSVPPNRTWFEPGGSG